MSEVAAALYAKEHTVKEKTFRVQYYTDAVDGYFTEDVDGGEWVEGHDAGISIKWSCGDTIGTWSVEEFDRMLKVIAKTSDELPFRAEFHHDYYLVFLDKEDGRIIYTDMVYSGYEQRGPLLGELRKALRGIKAEIKKQGKVAS